jgi:hypothetical protein
VHAKATSTSDVVETFPPFDKWLHLTMCMYSRVLGGLEDLEIYDISIPLGLVAKSYKSMSAYRNHFRTTLWSEASNMAIYDSRVIGEFQHTLCVIRATPNFATIWMSYVGECKVIFELDYNVTKVHVLLYSWVQATTRDTQVGTKKDEFGFNFVHSGRLLLVREQPFVFLAQVEQYFFNECV